MQENYSVGSSLDCDKIKSGCVATLESSTCRVELEQQKSIQECKLIEV
jgi:hypothetical protein